MCGKNHTHDSSGNHWKFPHMFGFQRTHIEVLQISGIGQYIWLNLNQLLSLYTFFENFCRKYFQDVHIFSHQKFAFTMKKWKYDLEKKTLLIIGDQKSMINFYQFETTFWAKHSTQWKWNKILKIMSLVWKMSISWTKMLKNWTNVTNGSMPPIIKSIWGHIWKHTVEISQTNATNVTMHLLEQTLWGHIWKCTVEKSPTNAINVTCPMRRHLKVYNGIN